MDIMDRLLELSREGYSCTQIMLMIALESEEKSNPDLIRAIDGLSTGVGGSGGICGALTGGACFLAYFMAKGESDEIEHASYREAERELTEWFTDYCALHGGTDCRTILKGDDHNRVQVCPVIVRDTLEKCLELLDRYGGFR